MLTLTISTRQHEKMVSNQSLYLGSYFSNMVFQNESSESITNPNSPMPKSTTFATFFSQSLKPTHLIDNIFSISKANSNIVVKIRDPNKDVKRRSSKCNNNGRIMDPIYTLVEISQHVTIPFTTICDL